MRIQIPSTLVPGINNDPSQAFGEVVVTFTMAMLFVTGASVKRVERHTKISSDYSSPRQVIAKLNFCFQI